MDEATRARLEALVYGEAPLRGDVTALIAAYDALLVEQAQAAPVLAAADRWASGEAYEYDKTMLFKAVVAWRAAREG